MSADEPIVGPPPLPRRAHRLLPAEADGLSFHECHLSGRPGLHIVIGRNNAGKTRLLNAVGDANLQVDVVELDEVPGLQRSPSGWGEFTPHLRAFPVTWTRAGEVQHVGREKGAGGIGDDLRREVERIDRGIIRSTQGVLREPIPAQDRSVKKLFEALAAHLGKQPALLVSTDRQFEPTAKHLHVRSLGDPATWATLLLDLQDSEERAERERGQEIRQRFHDITEGLSFVLLGKGPERKVYVRESETTEYPLEQCGHGLRDLIGILLHVLLRPGEDLLIDEPGLRLHPSAQRRLLAFLEQSARERAIWVATHDAVFVTAGKAASRVAVRRDAARGLSVATSLSDLKELRGVQEHLGFRASDAFLADRVLFCEGPSDRVAFEAALRWLADDEPTFAGTVVCDLNGEGTVWSRDLQVFDTIVAAMRKAAPYASRAVLLDPGTHDAEKKAAVTARVREKLDVPAAFLTVPELEDLWLLDDELVRVLLEGVRDDMPPTPSPPAVPDAAHLREVLRELASKRGSPKGSKALNALTREVLGKRRDFNKVRGAERAVRHLETAPTSPARTQLMDEVRAALALGAQSPAAAAASAGALPRPTR